MEAFFDDAPSGGHACASMGDLQQHLAHQLQIKLTPTKAEHISITYELRSNVSFTIPVTEAENASLEAGVGIDPRLAQPSASVPEESEWTLRQFNAIDTVLNQSQNDNLVQRIVSKHIVSVIGDTDQSQWLLRSVARGNQGWTFTYSCKDSCQMWEKEKAKNPPKTVVGEWSNKDGQDPINMGRPAFDCQGSLTVAFSKSEKAISVKYDHTARHQTVEELMNILAPPPPPEPTRAELRKAAPKNTPKKTPKKTPNKRASQAADLTGEGGEIGNADGAADGATPKPNKRKKAAATQDGEAGGESVPKKKRSCKKRKTDDVNIDPALSMLPPEIPGALPVGDSSQRPWYNNQPSQDGATNSAYQEPVDGAAAIGTQDAASAMVSSSVHLHTLPHLPPGEAERRREVALRLLTGKNIDPHTLSSQQFSILANQSPQLQAESLEMLAKYGAERLKIILPDKDANAAAGSAPVPRPAPVPVVNQDQNGQPPPTAVPQEQNREDTPAGKGKRTKKPSLKAQIADTSAVTDGTPAKVTPKPRKPQLMTRGACDQCKEAKLKCDKVKPTCDKCQESGTACVYPAPLPKKSRVTGLKRPQSSAEPDQQTPEAQNAAPVVEEDPDDLPSPGFSAYYNTTQGNSNGNQSSAQQAYNDGDQYQSADAAESQFEQPEQESTTMENNHQSGAFSNNGSYRSPLDFPSTIRPQVTQQVWTSSTDYAPAHQSASTSVPFSDQTTSPTTTRASAARPATTYDHSKACGNVTVTQREEDTSATTAAADNLVNLLSGNNSWSNQTQHEAEPQAPTSNLRTSPRQSRQVSKPADVSAYHDGHVRSVSALAQAAMNASSKSASPVQPTVVPYETPAAASRAKSRQGYKVQAQAQDQPQTRTPVPNQQPDQRPRSTVWTMPSYSAPSDKTTASYKNASYYSTNADQASGNGVGYQATYQQNTGGPGIASYQSYEYNTRPTQSTNSTVPMSTTTAQASNLYTTSSTPSASTQSAGNTSRHSRNPLPYSSTQSAQSQPSASLNRANSSVQRSQAALQNFNVRPQQFAQPQSRTTTTASPYAQQPQQAYGFANQSQQQQPTANNNTNQQGWYTGNTSSTAYGTSGARGGGTASSAASANYSGGGTGQQQQYNQQQQQHETQQGGQHGTQQGGQHAHHAMNLSGHTYSSMDPFNNMLPGGGSGP